MRFHYCDQKTPADWEHREVLDLGALRRDVDNDRHLMPLVPGWGKAKMVLGDASFHEGELQARIFNEKLDDAVVRLVARIVFDFPGAKPEGTLHTESLLYSKLEDRIADLRDESNYRDVKSVEILLAATEDQLLYFNDLRLETQPKMPQYVKRTSQRRQHISRKDLKKMAARVTV